MIPGAPLTLRHRQVQTDRMHTTPDFPTPVPLALTSAVCVHLQVTGRGWFYSLLHCCIQGSRGGMQPGMGTAPVQHRYFFVREKRESRSPR